MARTFRTKRRIAFRDTDAAGIAHFSSFFAYMEDAEHEVWRELGVSVVVPEGDGNISWPRVSCQCDYTGTVRFEDVLEIEVALARLGQKSVTFQFKFQHAGRQIAQGSMTAVCCRFRPGQPPESLPIPAPIRTALENYFQGAAS